MKYLSVQPFLAAAALPLVLNSTQVLVAQELNSLREERVLISETQIVAAQQFGQTLSIAEWPSPVAPVALSPIFGITCLCGLSLFGASWISHGNPLVGESLLLHSHSLPELAVSMTLVVSDNCSPGSIMKAEFA